MQEKNYNVVLYSGLGERKGKLTVKFSGESCEGKIFIMENENYFSGKYDGQKWKLSGTLKTGIWDTEYEGYGNFSDDGLNFEILILGSHYEMTGDAFQ